MPKFAAANLLLVLVLTGCGGGSEAKTTTSTPPPAPLSLHDRGYNCVIEIVDQEGETPSDAYRTCLQAAYTNFGYQGPETPEILAGANEALTCLLQSGLAGCRR